jgi:hypothetical protein
VNEELYFAPLRGSASIFVFWIGDGLQLPKAAVVRPTGFARWLPFQRWRHYAVDDGKVNRFEHILYMAKVLENGRIRPLLGG